MRGVAGRLLETAVKDHLGVGAVPCGEVGGQLLVGRRCAAVVAPVEQHVGKVQAEAGHIVIEASEGAGGRLHDGGEDIGRLAVAGLMASTMSRRG